MLPLRSQEYAVVSDWWSGHAKVSTYELDELIATKLRALYQRRKGRDLLDLWYVTKNGLINLDRVFQIFAKYCANDGANFTEDAFIENLKLKHGQPGFQSDMHPLLPIGSKWNFNEAYEFVLHHIIAKMP